MREIGIDRRVEIIKVGGKEFEIGMIPIKAELYIAEHDKINTEYDKKLKDIDDLTIIGNIVSERNQKCGDIVVMVLKSILIANGYEFDEEWWMMHIDYSGIVELIAYVKAKDFVPSKKKQAPEK